MVSTLFRNPPILSLATQSVVLFLATVLGLLVFALLQFWFPELGDLLVSLLGGERISALVRFIF